MDYSAYYSMVDTRDDTPSHVGHITSLAPTEGGILYWDQRNLSVKLEWDDEDPDAFIDDEETGTLIVVTATGSVLFQKVST